MDKERMERISRFIESIERYSFELNDLKRDIQNNEFDIKMLAQDINVYTNDFLYDIYGLKVYIEYPDWFWTWTCEIKFITREWS